MHILDGGYVNFGLRCVSEGYVDGFPLYRSNDEIERGGGGVRPVVTLKSNILIGEKKSTGWQLIAN